MHDQLSINKLKNKLVLRGVIKHSCMSYFLFQPEDQLQQVMNDLEDLLSNATAPVLVSDIEPAFDQVPDIYFVPITTVLGIKIYCNL